MTGESVPATAHPIPNPRADQRKIVHARVEYLKKSIVTACVVLFAGVWWLVAHHQVGVTSRTGNVPASQSSQQQPAQAPDSGPYFGGGDDGSSAVGPGGGNASGPVMGSSGS